MSKPKYALAIHGGAGTLVRGDMSSEKEKLYTQDLLNALEKGQQVLAKKGTSTEAVCASVSALEDSPLFNAGRGSVFNAEGKHEMDASIMEGHSMSAGAVSLIQGIRNPIKLALEVMHHSEHVLLAGEGAMQFAISRGWAIESDDYFYDEYRYQQWQAVKGTDDIKLDHWDSQDKKFGTVGAVALDLMGNLAAATSTGGMTNKKYGRIGDTPIIGAGTYADDRYAAVSCTGSGEYFMRAVAAYDVIAMMRYNGMSLAQASDACIHKHLQEIGGDGGLIAVDAEGNISMPFNTEGMYRASIDSEGIPTVAIYES